MARVLRLFLLLIGLALITSCGSSDTDDVSSQQAEADDQENAVANSTDDSDSAGGGDTDNGNGTDTDTDENADNPEDEAAEGSSGESDDGTDDENTGEEPVDDDSDGDSDSEDAGARAAAPDSALAIDWWACWRAADSLNADGGTPSNGGLVAQLPNCATGPSSIGSLGDMSHASARPVFRSSGANGNASIEFTFDGDTLLQTNSGSPWTGDAVLKGPSTGVTLAWVGMTTDVNSHNAKYLVSGLDESSEYPMLLIEGEGPNRFAGYGGGTIEARSSDGTVVDFDLTAVIMYLAPDGSASVVEVDGSDVQAGQDSIIRSDVAGLTLGNVFSRNFSTTDHHFVFLGMYGGQLSDGEKAAFWDYASGL